MWYRVKQGRIRSCRIETDREDVIKINSLQQDLSDVVALGSTMAEAVSQAVDDANICKELTRWLEKEMHL